MFPAPRLRAPSAPVLLLTAPLCDSTQSFLPRQWMANSSASSLTRLSSARQRQSAALPISILQPSLRVFPVKTLRQAIQATCLTRPALARLRVDNSSIRRLSPLPFLLPARLTTARPPPQSV